MHDVIVVMSEKRLGLVGVTDEEGFLVGIITDGDLRRHMEEGLDHVAREFMTPDPKTISKDALVDDALHLFEQFKITALFVVEEAADGRKRPVGVLHIHDCPTAR
jgi:arabinose-5-phosphate isomerase